MDKYCLLYSLFLCFIIRRCERVDICLACKSIKSVIRQKSKHILFYELKNRNYGISSMGFCILDWSIRLNSKLELVFIDGRRDFLCFWTLRLFIVFIEHTLAIISEIGKDYMIEINAGYHIFKIKRLLMKEPVFEIFLSIFKTSVLIRKL